MIDDKNLNEIDLTEEDNRTLPEWEHALSEYAHKTAPDLLPDILAKINTAPPKQDDAERLRKYRRMRLIRRASAAAAAVLVVGIILFAITRVPKTKDDTNLTFDKTTPAVTTSVTPGKQSDSAYVNDSPTGAVEPKQVSDEKSPYPSNSQELTDPVSDPGTDPVDAVDGPRLGNMYKVILLSPGKYDAGTLSSLPDDISSNYKYYLEAENGATDSLANEGGTLKNAFAIRVGNATMEEVTAKCAYRLFAEGCNLSDVLMLSDEDFMYRTYETLTVVPVGLGEDGGMTYRLFKEADATP